MTEKVKRQDLVQSLTNEISAEWHPEKPLTQPIFLLLGGFQGSGKTTVLETIKDELGLTVVSLDEIRFRLFERKFPFSDVFTKVVDETRDNLVKKALTLGMSLAVDTNITNERLKLMQKLLSESGKNHKLVSVLLKADPIVLKRRVESRKPAEGQYQGKVEELDASIAQHGDFDESGYNLIINTDKVSAQEVASLVTNYIEHIEALGKYA